MDDRVPGEIAGKASTTPVFISYATADRKQALSLCKAIERRGTRCWLSCRDVAPGENYQEAIVRSLRTARAMVLVFSRAANNSDEIKKELSLASRYQIPVVALRIEDVEPSDAFAYELSTRQWIDAFAGWDKSIGLAVRRIAGLSAPIPATLHSPPVSVGPWPGFSAKKGSIVTAAVVALLLAVALWWWFRPSSAAAHSMVVRLSGFQVLSADLSSSMPDTVREEIIAAFGDDGVIRVSTASASESGQGPAYALGGTIRRDGDKIRVITRLVNERSAVMLWSDSFDYDSDQVSRVPRRIAVDAGNMVHCGLFAASTYHKPLPDAVMSDYMQFCQNSWWSQSLSNPEKALDAARKVAAAVPDFSWGWSAITVAAEQVFYRSDPGPHREEVRDLGLRAADKALAIDPKNSEAFAQKSLLIAQTDWAARETLLKKAIAARPLFCGCEHYLYGVMLRDVGRYADAMTQMRRSTEMLALDGISQFGLADALLVNGKPDEAKSHFEAVVDLFRQPDTGSYIVVTYVPETGDYAAGIKALGDSRLRMSQSKRSAIAAGFAAMAASDPAAKARAVAGLTALPANETDSLTPRLLSVLGGNREALRITEREVSKRDFWAASWFWYPSMRGTLNDPAFLAVAQRVGLINYWRTTHTRPDICSASDPPPFCKSI